MAKATDRGRRSSHVRPEPESSIEEIAVDPQVDEDAEGGSTTSPVGATSETPASTTDEALRPTATEEAGVTQGPGIEATEPGSQEHGHDAEVELDWSEAVGQDERPQGPSQPRRTLLETAMSNPSFRSRVIQKLIKNLS